MATAAPRRRTRPRTPRPQPFQDAASPPSPYMADVRVALDELVDDATAVAQGKLDKAALRASRAHALLAVDHAIASARRNR